MVPSIVRWVESASQEWPHRSHAPFFSPATLLIPSSAFYVPPPLSFSKWEVIFEDEAKPAAHLPLSLFFSFNLWTRRFRRKAHSQKTLSFFFIFLSLWVPLFLCFTEAFARVYDLNFLTFCFANSWIGTRGNGLKLIIPHSDLHIRQKFYFFKFIKILNDLLSVVLTAASAAGFKQQLIQPQAFPLSHRYSCCGLYFSEQPLYNVFSDLSLFLYFFVLFGILVCLFSKLCNVWHVL